MLPLVLSRNRNHAGVVNCAPAVLVNHISMRRLPHKGSIPMFMCRSNKKKKRGKGKGKGMARGGKEKERKSFEVNDIGTKSNYSYINSKVFMYYVSRCKSCTASATTLLCEFPDQGTVDTAYNVSSYALNHLGEMQGGHAQPQWRNH
jgi:hypothetical protein